MAAHDKRSGAVGPVLVVLMMLSLPGLADGSATDLPDAFAGLGGSWWETQRFVDRAEMPILGRLQRETTAVLRVEIVQSGSEIAMTSEYCRAEVQAAVSGLTMIFPDAFVGSLLAGKRLARLDGSAGEELVGFEQDWYVEVRGADLDDPASDPLPEAADDPRVFDQDGDGHPGMTVRVDLLGLIRGEVYVVQRVRYRLIGWVESDGGSIFGRIEWEDEQVVIGASSPLLAAGSPGVPVWEDSSFRFVRAARDDVCDREGAVEEDGSILESYVCQTDRPAL